MKSLAVMLLLALAGCVHRPGGSWPYTTRSYAEDDVVYQGVGIRF